MLGLLGLGLIKSSISLFGPRLACLLFSHSSDLSVSLHVVSGALGLSTGVLGLSCVLGPTPSGPCAASLVKWLSRPVCCLSEMVMSFLMKALPNTPLLVSLGLFSSTSLTAFLLLNSIRSILFFLYCFLPNLYILSICCNLLAHCKWHRI